MKILVAGASGAIGKPLVNTLIHFGFDVFAITRTASHARLISGKGARPFVADVLDQEAVDKIFEAARPEVVINMLSSLPKVFTPAAMLEVSQENADVKVQGSENLLRSAKKFGTKRHIIQSCGFWYEQGEGLADEYTPFAFEATPGISAGANLYAEIEKRSFEEEKLETVALRFGFFYGPDTWFHPEGSVGEQIRDREFPLIGSGDGVWNFIHVEDAAKATAAAIYCQTGAYNIVNNNPVKIRDWLPALCRYMQAPYPLIVSEEEGLMTKGEDFVFSNSKLRGASNAKAKKELDFEPRTFEWLLH